MKNIIKKLLLAFSIGLFVGLGVLLSYAVNITSISQDVSSGAIIDASYFSDLKNRIININGSGGNVGIGTTSPSYKLHVNGDILSGWYRSTGNNGWYSQSFGGGWHMTDTTRLRSYGSKSIWTGTGYLGSDGGLAIGVGYTAPPLGGATIGGALGIGTAIPTQKLDVNGSIISHKNLFYGVGGNSGQTPYVYGIYQEAGAWTPPYPDLRIQYHTGIKYDAYRLYGGHSFYTGRDSTNNPSGLVMQITDKVRVLEGGIEFPNGTVQTTAAGGAPTTVNVSVLTSNCITKTGNQGTQDSVIACDAGYQVTGGGTWRNGCGDFIGTAPNGNGWKGRVEPCASISYAICCQTQTIKVIP